MASSPISKRVSLDTRKVCTSISLQPCIAKLTIFHPDVAYRCVDWIENLSCERNSEESQRAICFGIFTGTLLDGAPCATGLECVSHECWKENVQCTEACCHGVCTGNTAPQVGGVGDRCRYSACENSYCQDSLCVPLRAAGESCLFDRECEPGLVCESGRCTAPPGPGEPCTYYKCRDIGFACGVNGTCQPRGWLHAFCLSDDECSPYLQCSLTRHECEEMKDLGEQCFHGDCRPPYTCDYSGTRTCIVPKPDGERCVLEDECASGSCSDNWTCTSETCS